MRPDGRAFDELRQIKLRTGYVRYPEGSVLIDMGETRVLCNVRRNTLDHPLTLAESGIARLPAIQAEILR